MSKFLMLFRTRLLVLIFLVVLPALALVLHGYLGQLRLEKTRVREGAIAMSRLAAARQEYYVKDTHQLLATLTELSFFVLSKDRSFCQTGFSNLLKLSSDYVNFGLIESNGTVFCTGLGGDAAMDLSDRAYFRRVLEKKRFSLGDFQVGRITHEPTLNFGYPVRNEHGDIARIIFASLKTSLLTEAITNIGLPPGASVGVLDRSGIIVTRVPDTAKWMGKDVSAEPVVQNIISGKAVVFERIAQDGVKRLYAVTTISDGESPGLFVNVGIPVAVSYANANRTLRRNLLLVAAIAAVIWVLLWFLARRFFLKPIDLLAAASKRLALGDLAVRIGNAEGAGELAELGRTFDEMAEQLEKRAAEINRLNADLEKRVEERTSQLAAANQELEAFCYSVSHDLRSPLRHIGGYTSMLQRHLGNTLDEKGRRLLNTVSDSTRRMGILIDDLLAFSRMGRAEMQEGIVDMNALLEEVVGGQQEAQGRHIEWKKSHLPKVKGDSALLRQVLVNLISNAVKYTRPRDPAIIEVGYRNGEERDVTFFVRDNGVGFDPAYAHKLFGVFQRLHDAEKFEGTGIGLANVRRIIQRHHGQTWAESVPGEGATFYFSLPKASD